MIDVVQALLARYATCRVVSWSGHRVVSNVRAEVVRDNHGR